MVSACIFPKNQIVNNFPWTAVREGGDPSVTSGWQGDGGWSDDAQPEIRLVVRTIWRLSLGFPPSRIGVQEKFTAKLAAGNNVFPA